MVNAESEDSGSSERIEEEIKARERGLRRQYWSCSPNVTYQVKRQTGALSPSSNAKGV